MRHHLILLAALAALFGSGSQALARQPNIVFFLVDDLGCMDIGAYNPDTFYETPRVDQLAREGVRFSAGYAANPVCSPTRYSIMTGKYPSRVQATNWFSGNREARFRGAVLHDRMPLEEVTLAEALREAGYRTAFLGKWHLGGTEDLWPEHQGFEVNIGGHHRGSPPGGYFAPYNNPRLTNGPDGEHLPERLANEAIGLMEKFKDDPFLIYLSFYSVHTPLQARPELVQKYQAKAAALKLPGPEFLPEEQVWPVDQPRQVRVQQRHAVYAAMVESMDTQVGRVLDKIKDLGLEQDTVVCFMSDNGGLSTSEGSPTSNLPYRGGKGWLYEGGIREPFIIKWPGRAAPAVCDVPVISNDFYPTLLEIAGVPPRPDQHRDGVSLVPLLRGKSLPRPRPLFWHYPHYSNQGGFPGGAVRDGDYKLIERFEDGRVHLYHLNDDQGEQHDLAAAMPDKVNDLRARLHRWYTDVNAHFLQAKPGGPQPWKPSP